MVPDIIAIHIKQTVIFSIVYLVSHGDSNTVPLSNKRSDQRRA